MAAKFAIATALMLVLPGTAAIADELDQQPSGFYADPVLSDPPLVPAHAFNPAIATAEVATVAPALSLAPPAPSTARPGHEPRNQKTQVRVSCATLNPCATTPQAAPHS